MKICIWCTKIFDLGGTKRVVTLLANELVKEHDVTIMVYEDRFKEDRNMYHMSEDIKVDFIDNDFFVNRHHTPAFCWRYLVRKLNNKWGIFNREKLNSVLADAIFPKKTQDKWVEYLNEQDYDIIITTASLSLRLGMLAPRLKAKTIGWQHNCFDGYLKVPNVVFWKQEALLQEYLPKLDRYIVLSDYDKRDYKKILGIVTEVKINPRSFVSEKKCDPEAKRFLMATRFVYAKGLDLMMEAFEKFCREDDEWQLDIIGSGDLWNEIVADAKRRHIEDRVNFVGYTNEPEKYYLNSSVFLLPSRWEGWPMVIMEAFEFGLPVIAFHTGAMDLIIDDGKTGFLPEAFDVDKFAQAMLKLAHDDELRRKMSRNAIWKSEDFAIEKAVSEWNHLFEELMRRGEFYEQNKKAILQCRYKYQMRTICAEYVKEYPVEEKTILYEAFGGRGMICNPYAIFKYLISEEKYRDYKHIWIIDDYLDNGEEIEKYKKYPNVKFVKYKSKEYCNMKFKFTFILLVLIGQFFSLTAREVTSFNEGWLFKRGPFSEDPVKVVAQWEGKWETVSLPHTWNAKDMQVKAASFYEGVGYYKKKQFFNEELKGKRVFLRFEGVGANTEVYVNSKLVGTHKGGYSAFAFEIGTALKFGAENEIMVKADNTARPDVIPVNHSLFGVYGGIYRPVWLIITEQNNITVTDCASPGVYITQKNVSKRSADITVKVKLDNGSLTPANLVLENTLYTQEGKRVASHRLPLELTPQGTQTYFSTFKLNKPHLWQGRKDPYLYKVVSRLVSEGKVIDEVIQPLGVRKFEVVAGKGFYLNDEKYPMYGVTRHQDWWGLGSALTNKEHDFDLAQIMDVGATTVRFAHYQQSDYLYSRCDSLGLVIWAEIPFVNRVTGYETENAQSQLRELIRQSFNHPSIYVWGLHNEVYQPHEYTAGLTQALHNLAKTEDPDRYTVAVNGFGHAEHAVNQNTDIQDMNR